MLKASSHHPMHQVWQHTLTSTAHRSGSAYNPLFGRGCTYSHHLCIQTLPSQLLVPRPCPRKNPAVHTHSDTMRHSAVLELGGWGKEGRSWQERVAAGLGAEVMLAGRDNGARSDGGALIAANIGKLAAGQLLTMFAGALRNSGIAYTEALRTIFCCLSLDPHTTRWCSIAATCQTPQVTGKCNQVDMCDALQI